MQVPPVAVVGNPNAPRIGFGLTLADRHGERLHTLCGGNQATVAVGLLRKGLVLLYQHLVVAMEFLVPLDGAEIGGGEQDRRHGKQQLERQEQAVGTPSTP